ncbi:N-acetyltransferase [Photobacterium profundum]|uniref:N-acetyltransferase domain-containing protein n=1 Tax=Photobacterium profundum 3TCK TaxID=314280 RepID=Q1Z558_9GAMM|nr:GNAT family protein [Photobacterium profundum]EAS43708.1 hypothetical protein P3TCK_18052 [Photobacterium profundum 3TCK]PSV64116.1 N-acetyltransferase [Photobacterium profundum]
MKSNVLQLEDLKQGKPVPLSNAFTIQLIRQEDFTNIRVMLENPNVTKFLFFAPAPIELYEAFFLPIIENTEKAIASGEWPEHLTIIIRDQNHQYMGMAGLTQVMLLAGNFEVGFQLPEHAWGLGIGTLTCEYLTKVAFEQLNAHKVAADCYSQNLGSAGVLRKSGYALEGNQAGYFHTEELTDDRLLFGMTASQYLAKKMGQAV